MVGAEEEMDSAAKVLVSDCEAPAVACDAENGLTLRGAAQGGELGLAVALFVRVDAFDHLGIGAWGWVGVDREVLDGRVEFGETLLHAGVEAVKLRAEDVSLPYHTVVLNASFELLEDGLDVAVAEKRGCH
jgi:hypothetical protein